MTKSPTGRLRGPQPNIQNLRPPLSDADRETVKALREASLKAHPGIPECWKRGA